MSDDPILDALLDSIAPPDESRWLKICIYGPPGVGKTILAATAPSPMFVDVENGYVSVHNHPELLAASKRMRFMGVKAVERLAERLDRPEFATWDTVVIDTATALQDRALKEITIAQHKKTPIFGRTRILPRARIISETLSYLSTLSPCSETLINILSSSVTIRRIRMTLQVRCSGVRS